MNADKKSFQYGPHTVTIETGASPARPTAPSVVSMGDTVVLVTAVGRRRPRRAGLLPADRQLRREDLRRGPHPGGFFKREGRPTEKETLTSRLIDRPIRPLFPDNFY